MKVGHMNDPKNPDKKQPDDEQYEDYHRGNRSNDSDSYGSDDGRKSNETF
jgi:hypothetical protein